jgi:hypothetical protein
MSKEALAAVKRDNFKNSIFLAGIDKHQKRLQKSKMKGVSGRTEKYYQNLFR